MRAKRYAIKEAFLPQTWTELHGIEDSYNTFPVATEYQLFILPILK